MHKNELKTKIQNILQSNNLAPEKMLGQNFLVDPLIVEKIANNQHLQNIPLVVEVGTGLGAITEALAQNDRQVITLEKSRNLYPIAKQLLAPHANVQVVCGDILKYTPPQCEYALVGAPPYYLTARLLRTFLQLAPTPPTTMVLLIQKQVAQKIIQTPPNASLLSTAVHIYGTPNIECVVPQNAFIPQPKVQSALLVVRNIQKPPIDEKALFRVINSGFAHPRKTIFNNLLATFERATIQQSLAQHNINPHSRAQILTPHQWTRLSETLCITK